MAAWTTPIAVNGALADSLVFDFGGTLAVGTSLPPDCRLCVQIAYASSAPTQLQLWLATGVGVAAELRVFLYDSAFQTNPGPDSTQYITNLAASDVIQPGGIPYQLRITKAASTANIWLAYSWKMGPN